MREVDRSFTAPLLTAVVRNLLKQHPWPWRADFKNKKVIANDGTVIAEHLSLGEAGALVDWAAVLSGNFLSPEEVREVMKFLAPAFGIGDEIPR